MTYQENKTIRIINDLVLSGSIFAADNRCWWTCYSVWKKLPKVHKSKVKLIEGTYGIFTHYWLSVDNIIVDPHYSIIEDCPCFSIVEGISKYNTDREIDMKKYKLIMGDFEIKPSINIYGEEKNIKVFTLYEN